MQAIYMRVNGLPTLVLGDMSGKQAEFVWNLMVLNRAETHILEMRARAGAHMDKFDWVLGTAEISIHGEGPDTFLDYLAWQFDKPAFVLQE